MNEQTRTSASEEFEGHVDSADTADVDEMALRLERDRPLPRAGFRAQLRSRLAEVDQGETRLPVGRLRLLIATYAVSGIACLVVAALSLSGAGPLAP